MPRKQRRAPQDYSMPKLANPNHHKAKARMVLSGKVIPPETVAKTPNQWLDPGWKLFQEKRRKRWSTD